MIGILLYPRAKWLFAFLVLGVLIVALTKRFAKPPSAGEVADFAERILNGAHHGLDVDRYEHLNPRDQRVADLWRGTMDVGGLPEEWASAPENKKAALREIIEELRNLGTPTR